MEERRTKAFASFVVACKLHLSRLAGLDRRQSSVWALAFAFKAVIIRKEPAARRSGSQPDCFELLASKVIEVNAIAYLQD